MNKIIVINTGGTFNKRYNPLEGELQVPHDNTALETIFNQFCLTNKVPKIKGIIYKDSLEINKKDRKQLVKMIKALQEKNILIVHGTDTMDKTAAYLHKHIIDKQIVITGAMTPFSIKQIEAVSNLMQGYGFLQGNKNNGIYISMNGFVKEYTKIKKNRKLGVFQCQ